MLARAGPRGGAARLPDGLGRGGLWDGAGDDVPEQPAAKLALLDTAAVDTMLRGLRYPNAFLPVPSKASSPQPILRFVLFVFITPDQVPSEASLLRTAIEAEVVYLELLQVRSR